MHRRFLNLITHDWDRRMYSLHRLDSMKHLFYPSSAAAREAAARDAKTNKKNKPSIIERLPDPEFSYHPTAGTSHIPRMDSFSLLGRHGVVFADSSGQAAAVYDTARGVFTVIPPANTRKENPLGMSFQAETEDNPSLYVLDLSCGAKIDTCFEVLARNDGAWCWRTLPGPPFLSGDGPPFSRRPTIQNCSYAFDGSTICISSMQQGVGTYAFDTASRAWRQVGEWALPFHGKAEYVPELKLWLGLLSDYCNPFPRLCAFDLSATAMDAAEHPPTLQNAWDYLDLCSLYSEGGDDDKKMLIYGLHLVNLGSGKFCIATHLRIMWSPPCAPVDEDMAADSDSCLYNYSEPEIPVTDSITVEEFIVFTGVSVGRCCSCDGPRMIKHKSKRYDLKLPMKAVL